MALKRKFYLKIENVATSDKCFKRVTLTFLTLSGLTIIPALVPSK